MALWEGSLHTQNSSSSQMLPWFTIKSHRWAALFLRINTALTIYGWMWACEGIDMRLSHVHTFPGGQWVIKGELLVQFCCHLKKKVRRGAPLSSRMIIFTSPHVTCMLNNTHPHKSPGLVVSSVLPRNGQTGAIKSHIDITTSLLFKGQEQLLELQSCAHQQSFVAARLSLPNS